MSVVLCTYILNIYYSSSKLSGILLVSVTGHISPMTLEFETISEYFSVYDR